MTICPICGNELKAGEKLIAEYASEYGWWVLEHVRDYRKDYAEGSRDNYGIPSDLVEYRGWCGLALTDVRDPDMGSRHGALKVTA